MKGRHAKNRFFAIMTALLLIAATLGSAIGAMAATTDTIDTSAKGSIKIYKYDWTAAYSQDSTLTQEEGTGEEISSAKANALAPYALKGVTFSYVKVGEIYTYTATVTDAGGSLTTVEQVLYEIPSTLMSILGLTSSDAVYTASSVYYFDSDTINAKLKAVNSTASGKTSLETWIAGQSASTVTTVSDGSATASNLSVGLYLVIETSVPENVYSTTDPFFVSIPMTTSDGSSWNYNVTVYPKNQTVNPDIDKVVSVDNKNFADTQTASIGDTLTYRIVSNLPTITSSASYLDKYEFKDVISSGLTYTGTDSVTVSIYNSETEAHSLTSTATASFTNSDFTATIGKSSTNVNYNDTLTVKLTDSGLNKVNTTYTNGSYYIVVEYTVTINSNAVLGDSGNPNTVDLTYSRTSTSENKISDRAKVYSYGIDLTKEFSGNDGDPTKVQFVLYNSTDGYYVTANLTTVGVAGAYTVDDSLTTQVTDENSATKFSPASDGSLTIDGLEAGSYVMTEIQTDSGYSLLKDSITITIVETTTNITASEADVTGVTPNTKADINESGQTNASATVSSGSNTVSSASMSADNGSTDAYVVLTVKNTKSFTLPQTGGLGTILFTIGGALVVILGAVYLTRGKKKTAEQ